MTAKKIVLFSLSTCGFCLNVKKMLEDLQVPFTLFQVDEMGDDEKKVTMQALRRVNPKCSFPTVLVDDEPVIGYKIQEIKEKIGIRTEVDNLYDMLKKVNEPKGYFLNGNKEKTFELLRGLLTNKKRYGYMACPCRLAHGELEADRDIVCPCDYRAADVDEFGSCYCTLYVSADWYTGKIDRVDVPERRPPERYEID